MGLVGFLSEIEVDVNKKSVCGLSPGGVFVYDVPSGDVYVGIHHWGDVVGALFPGGSRFHVEGGKTYYFEIVPYYDTSPIPAGVTIEEVGQDVAKPKLSSMNMEKCS